MRQARNNPAQEAAAKTRHLNIWVGADEALFSLRSWHEATDTSLSLDDFEGQDCHLGLDLASRTDLAALSLVFPSQDLETGRTTLCCLREMLCQRGGCDGGTEPFLPWLGCRGPSRGHAWQ